MDPERKHGAISRKRLIEAARRKFDARLSFEGTGICVRSELHADFSEVGRKDAVELVWKRFRFVGSAGSVVAE